MKNEKQNDVYAIRVNTACVDMFYQVEIPGTKLLWVTF